MNDEKPCDIFKDTPIRYLGYANEVGESFRALIHVNWVRLSYVVASGYVVADAGHKGYEASTKEWPNEDRKRTKILWATFDTLLWQGLASVAIPGFTINRICKFSGVLLKKATALPGPTRKWITTAIGLGCIPFIIKPIDKSVDYFMEKTVRHWFSIDDVMESVVHHDRNG